ncbi:uncharacterized protein [Drosophila bipectinata]|uniref:uncharacterized protein isoform X2 n=1 Tax=Drosophila bipectinata TaxID=42026 RepID=UPI0038B3E46F
MLAGLGAEDRLRFSVHHTMASCTSSAPDTAVVMVDASTKRETSKGQSSDDVSRRMAARACSFAFLPQKLSSALGCISINSTFACKSH